MARFQIARLLGAVLTISVMTGSVAFPAMFPKFYMNLRINIEL